MPGIKTTLWIDAQCRRRNGKILQFFVRANIAPHKKKKMLKLFLSFVLVSCRKNMIKFGSSVTRFGEKLAFWQYFKSLW